jgi:hypothetical protein
MYEYSLKWKQFPLGNLSASSHETMETFSMKAHSFQKFYFLFFNDSLLDSVFTFFILQLR